MERATYCAICGVCFFQRAIYHDPDTESDDNGEAEVLAQNGDKGLLDDLYVFGYNSQATEGGKTFFTGPGVCSPFGEIGIIPEKDPNSPFGNYPYQLVFSAYTKNMYWDWTPSALDIPPVYPVHRRCFNLLNRCLTGLPEGDINEDVLLSVFQGLATDRDLRVNYGVPSPPREHSRELSRGQEAVFANPLEIPELVNVLEELRVHFSGAAEEQGVPPADYAAIDPFNRLPNDIRLEIFQHLPITSILAVRVASGAMRSTVILPKWWARKIQNDKPWLWELQSVVPTESTATARCLYDISVEIDCKGTYDEASNCFWGGLVNRQRIWNVCEQIKTVYDRQLAAQT